MAMHGMSHRIDDSPVTGPHVQHAGGGEGRIVASQGSQPRCLGKRLMPLWVERLESGGGKALGRKLDTEMQVNGRGSADGGDEAGRGIACVYAPVVGATGRMIGQQVEFRPGGPSHVFEKMW